jgi:hypothetical protein
MARTADDWRNIAISLIDWKEQQAIAAGGLNDSPSAATPPLRRGGKDRSFQRSHFELWEIRLYFYDPCFG